MRETMREEYEYLKKRMKKDGMLFECGVSCGRVMELQYDDSDFFDEKIRVIGYAGFDDDTVRKILFTITEQDLQLSSRKRRYKYLEKWKMLELYN